MNYTEEIYFGQGTGLDVDSDKKLIAKGDSDYILNMVPNGDGKQGTRTSIRGNRLIAAVDYGLSDGGQDYTVIGDCYDAKRNCQYIFVYGSAGSHSILKYTYSTDALSFFLQANDKIGLSSSYLITDACVIGDTLFFNPRSSSPRAINIAMMDNYNTYAEYVAGTSYVIGNTVRVKGKIFDVIANATGAEILADIKAGTEAKGRFSGEVAYHTSDLYFYNYAIQPTTAPQFVFGTDTTRETNNLAKNIFQFCYRYVYLDDSMSVPSPYSIAAVPVTSESYYGQGAIQTNNKLEVTVYYPADNFADFETLAYVEVFFRQSEDSGWGVWKMIDRIDWRLLISPTTEYTINFYNDKSFTVSDQAELARQYSALPKTARAQASLMNDRISYGGVTEGFDNVSPIVTLTPQFSKTSIYTSGTLEDTYTITEAEVTGGWRYTTEALTLPTDGYLILFTVLGVSYPYIVDTATTATVDELLADLALFVTQEIHGAYDATADTDTDQLYFDFREPTEVEMYLYSSATASFFKSTGFKTGATHKFCIFYYDDLLRRSDAMISDGLKVYLPFITEQTIAYADKGKIYKSSIAWAISHAPPIGTSYYRFGYAGNTTLTYFIQYIIGAVATSGDFQTINIKPLQEDLAVAYPHTNVEPYEFEDGDRVRFITPKIGGATLVAPYGTYYDAEIVEYDATVGAEKIKIRTVDTTPNVELNTGSIVEIYRPQKTDTITYYEYGDLYNVVEDGDGDLTHETTSGTFVIGDIYHITREFAFPAPLGDTIYPIEAKWASDYYPSEVWGQGKVGYTGNKGEVDLNIVRYSDPYLQDTDINGLNSFQFLNYESVNNKYGRITGMCEVGHTLRVYLETNSLSVPVGRTMTTNADGTETMLATDRILGTQRIDVDGYGTVFPESICRVGTAVYFFDSRKGCVVRDSMNGAIPINNKMDKFFKDKKVAIRSKGESLFTVQIGWDALKDLAIISFNDADNGDEDDILAFHEKSNRWVTYLIEDPVTISNTADMPEWLSKQGNVFLSYLWGNTYVHDTAADYCKFYGVQYGIESRVYSSDGNNVNKVYEAVAVHCNQQLTLDAVYVHTDETNEGYMLSRVPDSWWEKIEGVYHSPYLRNMVTNGVSAIKDLFNGDFLRGKVIENRFTKSSVTTELNLFKVNITTDESKI